MYYMFSGAGASATTFSLDLSGWDTSSVENMGNMFNSTGQSSTAFSINLSGWNTSNVTNMGSMFSGAGSSATATNWTIVIPQTNGNNINNTTNRLYGKTTSTYGTPPSGKSFTLAQ
jgi:surface protein